MLLRIFFLIITFSLSFSAISEPQLTQSLENSTLSFSATTALHLNNQSQVMEIIHHVDEQAIESALENKFDRLSLAASPDYERLLKDYFNQHFKIYQHDNAQSLTWVSFEVHQGEMRIYQLLKNQNNLSGLVVKNTILVDTYPNQVNIVNYQDDNRRGNLSFSSELNRQPLSQSLK